MKTNLLAIVPLLLTLFSCSSATRAPASRDYWSDIVNLCSEYSEATHPPCNATNGADMILNEVERSCPGSEACLAKAVSLCLMYSPATHPPCNAQNGLNVVVDELKRVAQFYPQANKN